MKRIRIPAIRATIGPMAIPNSMAISPVGEGLGVLLRWRQRAEEALGSDVEQHAGDHGDGEYGRLVVTRAESDDRGAGTEAGEPPADAEHHRAADQARIDVAPLRQQRGAEEGLRAPAHETEREE